MLSGDLLDPKSPMLDEESGGNDEEAEEVEEVLVSLRCSADCVVTAFSLETARNPLDAVAAVHALLKPGGYWINFGTTDYSHSIDHLGPNESACLELSWECLRQLVPQFGFEVVREDSVVCPFLSTGASMLERRYTCVHMVCRKV